MTEIAQLFESALRQNRASLLRQAARSTIARMPPSTTLLELLQSDAAEAVRALTLTELAEALAEAGLAAAEGASPTDRPDASTGARRARRWVAAPSEEREQGTSESWGTEANDAQLFRRILDAMTDEPRTIGQLSKEVGVSVDELRGYIAWMKKAGKVTSSGRARATRYQAVTE